MPVKIITGQQDAAPKSVLTPLEVAFPGVDLDQIESFGRLRLEQKTVAAWYGLTRHQIALLFARSDIRAAYDKGRAQTVAAIRQKQLQLALGNEDKQVAPDVRLLLHVGYHLADQDKNVAPAEPEDFEPTRFSWDVEMKKRLAAAREAVIKDAGQQEAS